MSMTTLWQLLQAARKLRVFRDSRFAEKYHSYSNDCIKEGLSPEVTDDFVVLRNGNISAKTPKRQKISQFRYTGRVLRGYDAGHGRGSSCSLNYFLLSTLHHMGGSESRSISQLTKSVRFGGGRVDSLHYLTLYNKAEFYRTSVKFHLRIKNICKILNLPKGCVKILSLDELKAGYVVNASANPGPSFTASGYASKLSGLDAGWMAASYYLRRVRSESKRAKPLFGLAGRAKLTSRSKIVRNTFEGKPIGRAVWMADMHESLLCAMFTKQLLAIFKRTQEVVLLGFNKFSTDVNKLTQRFNGVYNVYLNIDISKLDSNEKVSLLRRAFNVVRYATDFGPRKDNLDLVLDDIEQWYIHTEVVLPSGEIHETPGGGPSGSDFVSIINSICVSIVLIETYTALYGPKKTGNWDVVVYGDNSITGLKCSMRSARARRWWGRQQLLRIAGFVRERFGLTFNPLESRVALHWHVQYGVPILPPGVSYEDFSSDYLRKWNAKRAAVLGRPLRPEERIRIINQEPSGPAKGKSHRWTYVFRDSVQFLSYYFKESGFMIRPQIEVVERLLNPERAPSTLEEYKIMLLNALVENFNNQHTVNHLMHYYYDALCQGEIGQDQLYMARRECQLLSKSRPVPIDRSTLPYGIKEGSCRMWYRKQRKVVNLECSPCMVAFFNEWERILRRIREIYGKFGNAFLRLQRNALKACRLSVSSQQLYWSESYRSRVEINKAFNFMAEFYGIRHYKKARTRNSYIHTPAPTGKLARKIVLGDLQARKRVKLTDPRLFR